MKRSTIAATAILVAYIVIYVIIFLAVAKTFGSKSIVIYLILIALGLVGLGIITHKGLNNFLKGLDNNHR